MKHWYCPWSIRSFRTNMMVEKQATSSSNGTGSEKASGGGFFLNSKYKELLYIADDELFQTESSGLLKQKNTAKIVITSI